MSVPVEWSDVDGTPWIFNDEEVGPSLNASTSIDDYYDTWTTPGAFLAASASLRATYDPAAFLDEFDLSDGCVYDGRFDYSDELYSGAYDSYSDCDGTGSRFIVMVVEPAAQDALILLQAQLPTAADEEAFNQILSSFVFLGP